ncbi:MAG: LamG domain-containing protein [bacterium]|nr:LamG domain-containing protein [bacterium]
MKNSKALSCTIVVLLFTLTASPLFAQTHSLLFDGVNDYVECFDGSLPIGNTARTVECWVKLRSVQHFTSLVFYGTATNSQRFNLFSFNGNLDFVGHDNDMTSNFYIADNMWHHVCVTYNGTQVVLYGDGNAVASSNKNLNTVGSTLLIGKSTNPFTAYEFLDGHISELKIWNTARSQSEIQSTMYSSLTGTEPGLVGYWRFNEAAGTTAYNDVPGGANGTIYGASWSTDIPHVVALVSPNGGESFRIGTQDTIRWSSVGFTGNVNIELNRNYPTGAWETLFADTPNDGQELWTVTGPPTPTARIRVTSLTNPAVSDTSSAGFRVFQSSAPFVKSLSFDGVNDSASVSNNNLPMGNSQRTVECWFKTNQIDTIAPVLWVWGSLAFERSAFGLHLQNGTLNFFGNLSGDVRTDHFVADDCWHHVAVVYDGELLKIIADGEELTTANRDLNTLTTTSSDLKIGKMLPGTALPYYFRGNLSELKIWNTARSQSEIQSTMYSSLTGTEPSLVGYWRFNEGAGTTAYNDVPNGANGTIYGATWSADVPQFVRVTRPNGNEIFRAGTVDTLRWIGFNTGAMRIDLKRTYPTGSWVTLFDSVANTGFVPWLVTGETSTATRIRITTLAEPILSDTSDANFTIQYPEPAAPGNLAITTIGENANLTWARVDTNIYGQAITVERYIVFFRAQESYGWNFLAGTFGANATSYTHALVVTHSPAMYYEVRAWIGDSDTFDRIVREFSIGTPEEVVLQRLGGQVSRPIVKKVE